MKIKFVNQLFIMVIIFAFIGCQSKSNKLINAILEDNTALAKQLIEEEADVNSILTMKIINQSTIKTVGDVEGSNSIADFENAPALVIAARKNNLDIVKNLTENGADVNARFHLRNIKLCDALMMAVDNNNFGMVKLLLDHDADPNIRYYEGYTALILASYRGRDDIAKLLIEHGADVNAMDFENRSPLIWACKQEKVDRTNDSTYNESKRRYMNIIQLLLDKDAEINIQSRDEGFTGCTALMHAVLNGDIELVKLLLEHEADITLKNDFHDTVLDIAIDKVNYSSTDEAKMKSTEMKELIKSYAVKEE